MANPLTTAVLSAVRRDPGGKAFTVSQEGLRKLELEMERFAKQFPRHAVATSLHRYAKHFETKRKSPQVARTLYGLAKKIRAEGFGPRTSEAHRRLLGASDDRPQTASPSTGAGQSLLSLRAAQSA